MSTIFSVLRKVESLNVNDVAFDAMDAGAPEVAKLNTEMLEAGQNAKGDDVGQYRNEEYARMKNAMNPKPGFGRVDLRLTGSFYRNMVTSVVGDAVITESTDEKAAELAAKYGDDIYGLNRTFKARFVSETLRPDFNRRITDITGLKFN